MKNWKLIFNIRNYHYITIKGGKYDYLQFYYEHFNDFSNQNDFSFMVPEKNEPHMNTQDRKSKYTVLLKEFIENADKKTLFITEEILLLMIKEEKIANFFALITNLKKNIVYFYHSFSIVNDLIKTKKTFFETNNSQLYNYYSLLEKFEKINIQLADINFNLDNSN